MAETVPSQVGLWYHRGFLLLWGGQTISQLGSQVTRWALPLTAVLLLRASPGQMGLLFAAEYVPYLLTGLLAGVWVDRIRRRPLLIAADVGRALLLGSIPAASYLGQLSMTQLYIIGFLTGILTVLFDVAYQSFLPSLIARDQLIEGNSKLEASAAVAGIAGPGLAGGLVQLFTGPIAILADAFSFVVSALSLLLIHMWEPLPIAQESQRLRLWHEIGEGLHVILRNPTLRVLAGGSGLFNFFDSLLITVYILFLTKIIGVSAGFVGGIFALGGIGGLLGALFAGRITRAVGLGPALLGGALFAGAAELLIALAGGPFPFAVLLVIVGEASVQASAAIYGINGVSLRQTIVPDHLQGRVNSVVRVVSVGVVPLGALLGGFLGDRYGLRPTVLIAGCGTLLAFLWILVSPVRKLRVQPTEKVSS